MNGLLPIRQDTEGGGDVVLFDRAALGAEVVAVGFDFEEQDFVRLFGEGAVQKKDGGLDSGVGVEDAGGEGDDGPEVILLDEDFAKLFVGPGGLEDDALGDDDGGAAGEGEVLGHVVDEEDLGAVGLDGEALVGLDAALGGHEGRVGEDDVGVVVPVFLAGEGVVLENMGLREAVEVEVDEGKADHVGGDVVAGEVAHEEGAVRGGEEVAPHPRPLSRRPCGRPKQRERGGVGSENVPVGRDEEPGGAAGGVEDGFVLLGPDDGDHEVDDVAGGAELAGVALGAHDGEEVLESVAEVFGVGVLELVDGLEEELEGLGVAVREVGVLEDVAEELGEVGIEGQAGDGFGVEGEHLEATQAGVEDGGPGVFGVFALEETGGAAHLDGFVVHVVHELVDEGDGDLLDLGFGVGDLADQDVAGGIDAAAGFGIKHEGSGFI